MTWQPIETMPKEGDFLAWCPFHTNEDPNEVKLLQAIGFYKPGRGGRFVVAKKTPSKRRRYGKPHNVTDVNSPKGEQFHATHWMPLPDAPNGEDVEE